jgi:adenosylcobinamide kinase / adenosylcobinamide-phosphate guanylyltransferase
MPSEPPLCRSVLVLGGARSGKSRFARELAEASGLSPVLIATATAGDAEMADRIARHKAERDTRWSTIEEPFQLAAIIVGESRAGRVLVVDCLTLWLANLTFAEHDIEAATRALTAAVAGAGGPVVMVSNEIGLGLVPETALGRRFRDAQGRLNQEIAETSDAAVFVAAGLPLVLKPEGVAHPRLA